MMKTKAIAITAWIFFAVSFSGCTPKIVYLKCKTEKPERSEVKICGGIESDFKFAQCVASEHIKLQGDYNMLDKAFDSCK